MVVLKLVHLSQMEAAQTSNYCKGRIGLKVVFIVGILIAVIVFSHIIIMTVIAAHFPQADLHHSRIYKLSLNADRVGSGELFHRSFSLLIFYSVELVGCPAFFLKVFPLSVNKAVENTSMLSFNLKCFS